MTKTIFNEEVLSNILQRLCLVNSLAASKNKYIKRLNNILILFSRKFKKTAGKYPKLLRCRRAFSFQTIKDIDLKF